MNRRKLLGGVGAAGAALTTAGATQAAPATPDAALTVAVHRYTAARSAYDTCDPAVVGLDGEMELGDAYCATLDLVRDAPATTLAGLIAKARVAKKELAVHLDGSETPCNHVGDGLARAIVNDLLRLASGA